MLFLGIHPFIGKAQVAQVICFNGLSAIDDILPDSSTKMRQTIQD